MFSGLDGPSYARYLAVDARLTVTLGTRSGPRLQHHDSMTLMKSNVERPHKEVEP